MKLKQLHEMLNRNLSEVEHSLEFSKTAANILAEIKFSDELLADEQLKIRAAAFSDEEIIIWENPHYILTCLLWDLRTTNIHDHGFAGAFKVQGESRFQYLFEDKGTHIAYQGCELLEHEKVCEITKGHNFIHQIWHTTPKSMSIILREKKSQGQKDYFVPFFKTEVARYNFRDIDPVVLSSEWGSFSEEFKVQYIFNYLLKEQKTFNCESFVTQLPISLTERSRYLLSIATQKKFINLAASRYNEVDRLDAQLKLDQLFKVSMRACL